MADWGGGMSASCKPPFNCSLRWAKNSIICMHM